MVLLQCEFLIVRKKYIEVFQTFLLEKMTDIQSDRVAFIYYAFD